MKKLIKIALIITGTISVGFGVLGIILPLLPTTPFLLLGAACYIRSSEKFYNLLITNKWLGKYIKNYQEGKGIPYRAKILSIALLWLSIGYSAIFVVNLWPVRVILLIIATLVTKHILSQATLKEVANENIEQEIEGESE